MIHDDLIPVQVVLIRLDNVTISTIEVKCLAWFGRYETAISIDNAGFRVYQGYDTYEEAIKGHNKYCKMSKEEILNLVAID